MKRKPRPDPVIIEMRLSQVRSLLSRLSSLHRELCGGHIGWGNCECDLATIMREFEGAIHNHLRLEPKSATPYRTGESKTNLP